MTSNGRGIALGVVFGLLFVIAVVAIGFTWSAATIQTAGLPIDPPILFQPK